MNTSLLEHLRFSTGFYCRLLKNHGGDNLWSLYELHNNINTLSWKQNIVVLTKVPVALYPIMNVFIEDWWNQSLLRQYYFVLELWVINKKFCLESIYNFTNQIVPLKEQARSLKKEILLIENYIHNDQYNITDMNKAFKKINNKRKKNINSIEYEILHYFFKFIIVENNNSTELYFYKIFKILDLLQNKSEVKFQSKVQPLKFEEILVLLSKNNSE